jgi:hypothetical protein
MHYGLGRLLKALHLWRCSFHMSRRPVLVPAVGFLFLRRLDLAVPTATQHGRAWEWFGSSNRLPLTPRNESKPVIFPGRKHPPTHRNRITAVKRWESCRRFLPPGFPPSRGDEYVDFETDQPSARAGSDELPQCIGIQSYVFLRHSQAHGAFAEFPRAPVDWQGTP